jgi:hypothetical protein
MNIALFRHQNAPTSIRTSAMIKRRNSQLLTAAPPTMARITKITIKTHSNAIALPPVVFLPLCGSSLLQFRCLRKVEPEAERDDA